MKKISQYKKNKLNIIGIWNILIPVFYVSIKLLFNANIFWVLFIWVLEGRSRHAFHWPLPLTSQEWGYTQRCSQAIQEIWSLQHVLALSWGVLLDGLAQNTSLVTLPWVILTSGGAEEQRFYSELPLAVWADTLWRKLISAACIQNITLAITTQSSWP